MWEKGKYSLKGKCTLTSAICLCPFSCPQFKKTHRSPPWQDIFPREISGRLGMGSILLPSGAGARGARIPGVPPARPAQPIFTHTTLLSSYIHFLCFSLPYTTASTEILYFDHREILPCMKVCSWYQHVAHVVLILHRPEVLPFPSSASEVHGQLHRQIFPKQPQGKKHILPNSWSLYSSPFNGTL